jgi:pantetheine-phosphate adenylyltransferase
MSEQAVIAVYPGSFDPLHLGHVDIVRRAVTLFPTVVVAVLDNIEKRPLLSAAERVQLIKDTFREVPSVRIASFTGLLVDFMKNIDARVVLRGMRAVSDFEYEFQLSLMNRRLWGVVETVFLTPNEEYIYLSSRVVKEIWTLGGDVSGLVPEPVRRTLEARRSKLV